MQFHITHTEAISPFFSFLFSIYRLFFSLSHFHSLSTPFHFIALHLSPFSAFIHIENFVRLFVYHLHKFICFNGFIITFFGIIYCFTTTDQMHMEMVFCLEYKVKIIVGRLCCECIICCVIMNVLHTSEWKFLVAYGYARCEHRHRIYTNFFLLRCLTYKMPHTFNAYYIYIICTYGTIL